VSWHTTRVVPLVGDDSPTSKEHFLPACTCRWVGREWLTEFAAETEAESHRRVIHAIRDDEQISGEP
jgi:hypothetical protein